ncbi:hypothetical protein [Bradyrhizobium sp. USDA 4473]
MPKLPNGATLPPERKPIEILRHESGHLVIGRVLGFEYTGMVYEKTHAGARSDQKPIFSELAQVSAYLKLRIIVLYAGVMAESLNQGKVQNDQAIKLANGYQGSDDHQKVSEYSRIVAGIDCGDRPFDEVWKDTEKEVWKRAGELVEKYAKPIVELSRSLLGLIGGAETYQVTAEQLHSIPAFNDSKLGCEGAIPARITALAAAPKIAEKPQSD